MISHQDIGQCAVWTQGGMPTNTLDPKGSGLSELTGRLDRRKGVDCEIPVGKDGEEIGVERNILGDRSRTKHSRR